MSEKDATERATFGPKPRKKVAKWYETKWRTLPALHARIAALAKVEELIAESRTSIAGTISVNAQVNHLLDMYVRTYEAQFGPLPQVTDESALKRYAKKKAESDSDVCPNCGQKMKK